MSAAAQPQSHCVIPRNEESRLTAPTFAEIEILSASPQNDTDTESAPSGATHNDATFSRADFAAPPLLPQSAPSPAAWLALLIIGLYRKAISPLLPPTCRFLPSCSDYGYEAVARYGILAGGRLALWRILRCNPFGGSGYDPVP